MRRQSAQLLEENRRETKNAFLLASYLTTPFLSVIIQAQYNFDLCVVCFTTATPVISGYNSDGSAVARSIPSDHIQP